MSWQSPVSGRLFACKNPSVPGPLLPCFPPFPVSRRGNTQEDKDSPAMDRELRGEDRPVNGDSGFGARIASQLSFALWGCIGLGWVDCDTAAASSEREIRKTYSSALSLGVDELLAELIVVLGGALAGALNDNLLEVVRQLVDDVPELTGHQLVESPAALGVDLNSVD